MKIESKLFGCDIVYQFRSSWAFEEDISDSLLSKRIGFYETVEKILDYQHSQRSIKMKLSLFARWLQITKKDSLPLSLRRMDAVKIETQLLKKKPLLDKTLLNLVSIVFKLRITFENNSKPRNVELYGSKGDRDVYIKINNNELVITRKKEKKIKVFNSPKQMKKELLTTQDSLNTSASDCKEEEIKKTPPKKNKLRFKKPLKLNFEYKPQFSSFIPAAFRKKVYSEDKNYHIGVLKFFSRKNQYGFIMTQNEKDIFVHQDDLEKAHVDIKTLNQLKKKFNMILKFRAIDYQGKNKLSRKAIDLCIVGYEPRV